MVSPGSLYLYLLPLLAASFFSELLAFSSAIIGSVAGYYFSSKEK